MHEIYTRDLPRQDIVLVSLKKGSRLTVYTFPSSPISKTRFIPSTALPLTPTLILCQLSPS